MGRYFLTLAVVTFGFNHFAGSLAAQGLERPVFDPGSSLPPPFEGQGPNPGAPFPHRGGPIHVPDALKRSVRIDAPAVHRVFPKDAPPDFVRRELWPLNFSIMDSETNRPVPHLSLTIACASDACPAELHDGPMHVASDGNGRVRVSPIHVGIPGELVQINIAVESERYKAAPVVLTFDGTAVPTKGMFCVVNLSGVAERYADQYAAILYESLERSGFPLLTKTIHIHSDLGYQMPVDPKITLASAKDSVAAAQKELGKMQGTIQRQLGVQGVTMLLISPLNPSMAVAGGISALLGLSSVPDLKGYRSRVKVNGPGEETGWRYLDVWQADCKVYPDGTAVGYYAQYRKPGNAIRGGAFYKIGYGPVTIRRGEAKILELRGFVDQRQTYLR